MISSFRKVKSVTSSKPTDEEFEIDESAREWNSLVIQHIWPQAVLEPKYSHSAIAASPRTPSEPPQEDSGVKPKLQEAGFWPPRLVRQGSKRR